MNSPVVVEQSEETSELGVEGTDYEVVVIGAGVGGIYQIKRLIDLGVNATVLEGENDLGGTWYRNRYPGARFDSESFTYGYSWDQEILDEWHWTEMFSPQPETLKYLNFVAEKSSVCVNTCNSIATSKRWCSMKTPALGPCSSKTVAN